jgi:hypothetical protein
MDSRKFLILNELRKPSVIGLVLSVLAVVTTAGRSFADLTFHPTAAVLTGDSKQKDRYEREIFPDGTEIYVNRIAALRIAEGDIISITVREAPRDPFLDKTMEMAGRQRGREYPKLVGYEVIFRLQDSEAKRLNAFAQLHNGKTFAVKFRSLIISFPTFVGPFQLEGNEFALSGMSDKAIEDLKKLFPALKDDRKRN